MPDCLHFYRVRGHGVPFPLDMLRFDHSFPATELETDKIHRSLDPATASDRPVFVQLAAFRHETWSPARGRWESFGWDVVDHRVDRLD